jgi:hypothetical protein
MSRNYLYLFVGFFKDPPLSMGCEWEYFQFSSQGDPGTCQCGMTHSIKLFHNWCAIGVY